jgi:hypothetical protein
MTHYDQVEAVSIFARARPHADPAEAQAEASAKLVDAVVAAAREAGLEVANVSDHHATITGEHLRVHLTSGGPRGWPSLAAHAKPTAEPRWLRVAGIEYDAVENIFVGASPPSGLSASGVTERRSAVAVVADAIVTMLMAPPATERRWR